MRPKTITRIAADTLPLLAGIALSYFFWRNTILLAGIYLCAIAAVLLVRYEYGDLFSLLYGAVIGLIIE